MLQSPPWGFSQQGPVLDPNENRHGIKRKTDIMSEEMLPTPPPVKRFVSEEEMSFEMRRLQIETTTRHVFVQSPYEQTLPGTSKSPFVFNSTKFPGFGVEEKVQEMELEPVKEMPRLYLSDEISKMEAETPIPRSIINSTFQNRMALVPWVPRPLSQPADEKTEEENKTEEEATVEKMDLM